MTSKLVMLFVIVFIVVCHTIIRRKKPAVVDDHSFKKFYNIDDYESEINTAVFDARRCRTLADKIRLCIRLTELSEGIFGDYEDDEVYAELSETLNKSFTFRYSAFIAPYPTPQQETALERIYLTQTKALCPENILRYHFDGCYISVDTPASINAAIDDFFVLMLNVAYDETVGFAIEADDEIPNAMTNTVHEISREDLIAWLDDELVFRSFLATAFLNACRGNMEAEEKEKVKKPVVGKVSGNKIVR